MDEFIGLPLHNIQKYKIKLMKMSLLYHLYTV